MAEQNTDSTSFASILAGVQKLRGDAGGSGAAPSSGSITTRQQQQEQQQQQPRPVRPFNPPAQNITGQKRVNAFNKEPNSSTTPTPTPTNKQTSKSIAVSKRQQGNPLLQHIINVNWTYVESHHNYDYLVNGRNVIFLSLKYHKLHPEYLQLKMSPLMKQDAILLTVVDVENSEAILKEVNKMCLFNEFTLLLAFSFEQAAKYLVYLATTPGKVRKEVAP